MTSETTSTDSNETRLKNISLASRPAREPPTTTSATTTSHSDDDDDDYTSSSGSDSSDEDSDTDEMETGRKPQQEVKRDDGLDDALPQIPARQKPQIHRMERDTDLFSRLSAFLPQMKTANDELEREIQAGRGQDVRIDLVDGDDDGDDDEADTQDGKQYIEMNLGLGVLEEKRGNSDEQSHDPPAGEKSDSQKDSNVLGKLMGQENASSPGKPTIEEMRD